jgi:DNA (cytosine-5)-methyltransferase 1
MTVTVTDLFCGAGGSSTGGTQIPGVHIEMAANHNKLVTEIHNLNHPDTDHAVVDLHKESPQYFRRTDILWASPECTKWSQANGSKMPAIEEGLFEDPLSDDVKQRSRLLMFDVLRFIDHHRYRLVIVENVVDIATQAQYRTAWTVWRQELRALGYDFRVLSLNSMHASLYGPPAPQSRDRIYIVAWPEGETPPELDKVVSPPAHCGKCDIEVNATQSFKPNRTVGRYRQAYLYCCPRCGTIVEPYWMPAATAIDWSVPGQRIGDRDKPLADKTLARIAAGIARHWGPLTLEAGGNTYDTADPRHARHGDPDGYMRAWPTTDPLKALHTTNSKALAVPVEGRDGKEAASLDAPLRTQTTRAETALAVDPLVVEMYGTSTARPTSDAMGTVTALGNHHGLAQRPFVSQFRDRSDRNLDPATEPLRTIVADGAAHALVTPYYGSSSSGAPVTDPVGTLTTHDRYALVHRMNGDGAAMSTPVMETLRTLTTGGNVAVLQRPARRVVTPTDLAAARGMLDDILFRMFMPHEVAGGMAFPRDYKWQPPDRNKPISNRDLVKAAGNAVTPPSARDIIGAAIGSFSHHVEPGWRAA